MCRNDDRSSLRGVTEFLVATLRAHPVPAIRLKQLDNIPILPLRLSKLALSSRLDKRNLVDLFQRRNSLPHTLDRRIPKEAHPLLLRLLANLAARLLRQQHLANLVVQLQQFVDRRPAAKTRARALHASWPFAEVEAAPLLGLQPAEDQFLIGVM